MKTSAWSTLLHDRQLFGRQQVHTELVAVKMFTVRPSMRIYKKSPLTLVADSGLEFPVIATGWLTPCIAMH